MSWEVYKMRIGCKKSDAKRDAGLTVPEDLLCYRDLAYGKHKMNVLDVYRPKKADVPKIPVIVSVHGGGWVYGDKNLYQYYCMSLAQRGFVVVNFTYRLSPEHKFPCHLEDTAKVFDWVQKEGAKYGMDRDKVFAVGDSAGGHILSLFCLMCTNPEYAARYKFKVPEGFVSRAVALNCGAYDFELVKQGPSSTTTLMKSVLPKKGTSEEFYQISTVNHITENFPPCYIMTANEDFLREQPEPLKKVLDEKKVPYQYKLYGDDSNPQGHVFHLDMRNDTGKLCNDDECEYFKKFL